MKSLYDEKQKKLAEMEKEMRMSEMKLDVCKKKCNLLESVLGLRNRIQKLEENLFPEDLPYVCNRALGWTIILELYVNQPVVKQMRDRLGTYGI